MTRGRNRGAARRDQSRSPRKPRYRSIWIRWIQTFGVLGLIPIYFLLLYPLFIIPFGQTLFTA